MAGALVRRAVGDGLPPPTDYAQTTADQGPKGLTNCNVPQSEVEKGSVYAVSRNLAAIEIDRFRWEEFRTLGDRADTVPGALRRLFAAEGENEVMGAYWELENVVVVQSQLHSAALPTVSVLLAALLDEMSACARDAVVELLRQIVMGESDEDEVALGNADLGDQCRAAARQGLWLVYRELGTRRREAAEAVLEHIENDKSRLAAYLAGIRGK